MKQLRPPKALQGLTADDLAELDQWIEDCTYKVVIEKLAAKHNIKTSSSTLCRYVQTYQMANHLVDHGDNTNNVRVFLDFLNGNEVPYDEAGIALVQKRAFDLACEDKTSASKLAALLRIFHYKTSLDITRQRLAQTNRRNDISQQLADLKKAEFEDRRATRAAKSQPQPEKQEDDLGPFARNLDEIEIRAFRKFGIPEDQWEARRALNRKHEAELEKHLREYSDQQSSAPTRNPNPSPTESSPAHPQPEQSSIFNHSNSSIPTPAPSLDLYRNWRAAQPTPDPFPTTGDEDELTLKSLPSGIDPTIVPDDPGTWPTFYRRLIWMNRSDLVDYLRLNRIRVITPSTIIPPEFFNFEEDPSLSGSYAHQLTDRGIPWLTRHPKTNEWLPGAHGNNLSSTGQP